ncbi:MAG: DUF2191 domain-containing protein [Acidimicrobiia bacterium]|nr:DUF2191 domain-containing protein [Acidimicrobiia bacterium]
MKTTVEIADELLKRAKQAALDRETTLRDLIERGLRRELDEPEREFRLRDASVGGAGTQPGIDEGDWRTIAELAYEGRGG